MTKNQKLEELRKEIIKANPEIEKSCKIAEIHRKSNNGMEWAKVKAGRDITFFDCIKTFDEFGNYGYIAGHLAKIDRKGKTYTFLCKYNGGKPLHLQKTETIEFLHSLICKK